MIPFSSLALVQVDTSGAVVDAWVFADPAPGDVGEYALVSYSPGIAPVRRSRLGGAGEYDEVADQLIVHVMGGTPAQAVGAFERLMGAFDQAERWGREISPEGVQIRGQIQGGTVGELACMVLGAMPDQPPATPSPQPDELTGGWVIRDVTLAFRRRGLWLDPDPETTATGNEPVGTLMASYWSGGTWPTLSPMQVDLISDDDGYSGEVMTSAFWLMAGDTSQFAIIDVSSMAGTGATVAESAANFALSGTSTRRITPGTSALVVMTILSAAYASIPSRCATLHVFAHVRPASATPAWAMRAADSGYISVTPWASVPQIAGTSVVYLGALTRGQDGWRTISIEIVCVASSYPQTLDVDSIIFLAEDETTQILALNGASFQMDMTADVGWRVDARPLAGVSPRALYQSYPSASTQIGFSVLGDMYVQSRGSGLCGMLYAAPGTSVWRMRNSGASAVVDCSLAALRWRGYRVPQ